ncbi:MAG: aspartoacylase [Agarilytica sp.]
MVDIKQVAIVGGTHGNEFTGVHLVEHWEHAPSDIQRSNFNCELLLANPKARNDVKRYIDQDLNRQFSLKDLQSRQLSGYEHNRAKAINQLLGPKEDPRIDFIFDLHTTTANMGTTLVINTDDAFVLDMAFYIKQQMPEVVLFYEPEPRLENSFLTSLGRHYGLLIEVGATPQGLLRAEVVNNTKVALLHGLDFIEKHLNAKTIALEPSFEAFQFVKKIPFPENAQGQISAMIHPDRQDQDYKAIKPGDALFIDFDGSTISYAGDETVYAAFINEAAYYDRHIAMSLMKKIELTRPS